MLTIHRWRVSVSIIRRKPKAQTPQAEAKGLWEPHDLPDDHCLVVAESAIDALSYAALFPDSRTRYRSIGGQLNVRSEWRGLVLTPRTKKSRRIRLAQQP